MKTATLIAKHCKESGYYFKKVIPHELEKETLEGFVDIENYLDYAVPFKFGFIRSENKYEFPVPQIRVRGFTHYIHSFRNLDFKVGDMVIFDRQKFYVEDVNYSYYQSTNYKRIKNYFLTLK